MTCETEQIEAQADKNSVELPRRRAVAAHKLITPALQIRPVSVELSELSTMKDFRCAAVWPAWNKFSRFRVTPFSSININRDAQLLRSSSFDVFISDSSISPRSFNLCNYRDCSRKHSARGRAFRRKSLYPELFSWIICEARFFGACYGTSRIAFGAKYTLRTWIDVSLKHFMVRDFPPELVYTNED